MKRTGALLALAIISATWPSRAYQEALSISALPSLVLQNDPSAGISAQNTLLAWHAYQGAIAQALPQIDFSSNYSLSYTPDIKSQISASPSAPVDVDIQGQGTHLWLSKVSLSQLLPTAGSLFLSLENTMSVSTIGSKTVGGGSATTPEPLYSQKPKLSLGLTQPLFVNGKLLDLDIFPATFRKVQLGYLQQEQADRAQRNQAIGQALQLYLSIVQLGKSVTQTRMSLAVAEGNLAALEKNFSLGLVAEADLLDSKIGFARQKQGLLELSSTLAKTERLLAHSIGRESLEEQSLADTIPVLDLRSGREELIAKALATHPLMVQKGLSLEEKRIDDILAGQKYASSLSLSFSFSPRYPFSDTSPYTTTDLAGSFSDLFKEGWGQDYTVSAGLTFHLYDGGKEGEDRAGNKAVAAIAEKSLLAQRQVVIDQLEQDLLQKASLEEKIALLSESVDLAGKRLATEESLLALGKSTDLDVAAKKAEYEARANDLWKAKADLFLTLIDLYSLAGEDLARILEGLQR